eukprot:g7611.t1
MVAPNIEATSPCDFSAESTDARLCMDRAHTAEPSTVSRPLGPRTAKAFHPTPTGAPPHPDYQAFADVPFRGGGLQDAKQWKHTCHCMSRARTGRGDPRSVESYMTMRVGLTPATRKKRGEEQRARQHILRQQIVEACEQYDSEGSRRVSRANFIAALHELGLGLAFDELNALAAREAGTDGFVDMQAFAHSLLGSNARLLQLLHAARKKQEKQDGGQRQRASYMFPADARKEAGLPAFCDSLPHELRLRGRRNPLWKPKEPLAGVIGDICQSQRKMKRYMAALAAEQAQARSRRPSSATVSFAPTESAAVSSDDG